MSLENTFTLPATNTIEQNARLWAEHYHNWIEPGHGLFFDFKATPEYKKPVLDYLINNFGWILERPNFIRKYSYNKKWGVEFSEKFYLQN